MWYKNALTKKKKVYASFICLIETNHLENIHVLDKNRFMW